MSGAALRPASADALVIVDVQNDFLPGGALAVPGGDRVVAPLNQCAALFARRGLPVIATRDWHPPGHCSFQARGGPWPVHCVAGTAGARFPATLQLPADSIVVSKGQDADRDAYSGFQGTALQERLRESGTTRVFVGGLATDYCVLATVKDALASGLAVVVLEDAVGAVDLAPGDGARALSTMVDLGARLTTVAGVTG